MNPIQALTGYFKGVAVELRKVSWPTVPVLIQYFLSVVIGIALFTAFVGAADYLFVKALGFIIK